MRVLNISWLALTLVMVAACGSKGKSGSEGYFKVSDANLKTALYPLVVFKKQGSGYEVFDINRSLSTTSFGSGTSSNGGGDVAFETGHSLPGDGTALIGRFTFTNDNTIHMEEKIVDENEKDSAKGKTAKAYDLNRVNKQEALTTLRTFLKASTHNTFSADEEEDCRGAFDLTCREVYVGN